MSSYTVAQRRLLSGSVPANDSCEFWVILHFSCYSMLQPRIKQEITRKLLVTTLWRQKLLVTTLLNPIWIMSQARKRQAMTRNSTMCCSHCCTFPWFMSL